MKKLLLIGAVSIILVAAPNSIKTAYTISENNPKLDFNLDLHEFGNGSVLLEWRTGKEDQLTGFQIERMNADGLYQTCGFVPAFGSGEDHEYRFVDQPQTTGVLQYRILKVGTAQPEYIHPAGAFEHNADFTFLGVQKSAENESIVVNFSLNRSAELVIRVLSSTYKEISTCSEKYAIGKHTVELQQAATKAGFLEFCIDGKRFLQEIIL